MKKLKMAAGAAAVGLTALLILAFTDVREPEDPASHEIYGLESIGVIDGYPDGTFRPDNPISREEVSKVVMAFMDSTKGGYGIELGSDLGEGVSFPDMEPDRWSYDYVNRLSEIGIVEGYPDGEFKPAGKMTRAEFAHILYRLKREVYKDEWDVNYQYNGGEDISDMDAGHWAHGSVSGLVDDGLIHLDGESGSFRPDENITRAEVAQMLGYVYILTN